MAYTLPDTDSFKPDEWTKNKTIRANQTQAAILSAFIGGYEDFWGVENGTSKHTKEEMQAIIDRMPAALDILTDAFKFKTFASQAFPGALDEKYTTGVFAVTVDGDGNITVGELNAAWVPVVLDTPPTPNAESPPEVTQ